MAITIKNLSFSYNQNVVLDNISLAIQKGDIVSLLGKNGAGKTTLFKCILKLLNYKKGNIYIDDVDIKNIKPKQLSKKIAYIPQSHTPHFNYKVIDVVIMALTSNISSLCAPNNDDYTKAENILDLIGISDIANCGYANISGGQRQLVLIARALLQDAKVLIMDEPTSSLDYGNQIKIMQTIYTLSKKGYTILMSTHNPQHALSYTNKTLILQNGSILDYGDSKNVITTQSLKSIYNVDIDIKNIDGKQMCVPNIEFVI